MVKSLVAMTIDKWNDEPAPRFAAALPQMFLFGAAFIAVYASQYGSLVRPAGEAVAVHAASEGERADAR